MNTLETLQEYKNWFCLTFPNLILVSKVKVLFELRSYFKPLEVILAHFTQWKLLRSPQKQRDLLAISCLCIENSICFWFLENKMLWLRTDKKMYEHIQGLQVSESKNFSRTKQLLSFSATVHAKHTPKRLKLSNYVIDSVSFYYRKKREKSQLWNDPVQEFS